MWGLHPLSIDDGGARDGDQQLAEECIEHRTWILAARRKNVGPIGTTKAAEALGQGYWLLKMSFRRLAGPGQLMALGEVLGAFVSIDLHFDISIDRIHRCKYMLYARLYSDSL
jgi:hypothetical protein